MIAPVIVVMPQLLDAFDAADSPAALSELKQAATASAAAGGLAAALSLTTSAIEWQGRGINFPRPSRGATLTAIGTLVLAGSCSSSSRPAIRSTRSAIASTRSPAQTRSYGKITGSRFTYSGGLNRVNFWEVALDQAKSDPLAGGGAGSFRSQYLVDGNGSEEPRNAHSLPLEMLGELGIVGLLLLLTAFGAAVVAVLRSRREGRDAMLIGAVALAATAAVLAQAAVDWSWFFGALIAPPVALLGSAAAPAARSTAPLPAGIQIRRDRGGGRARADCSSDVSLRASNAAGSPGLALRSRRGDCDARHRLDLNPVAVTPLLVQSEIYRRTGEAEAAAEAARIGRRSIAG